MQKFSIDEYADKLRQAYPDLMDDNPSSIDLVREYFEAFPDSDDLEQIENSDMLFASSQEAQGETVAPPVIQEPVNQPIQPSESVDDVRSEQAWGRADALYRSEGSEAAPGFLSQVWFNLQQQLVSTPASIVGMTGWAAQGLGADETGKSLIDYSENLRKWGSDYIQEVIEDDTNLMALQIWNEDEEVTLSDDGEVGNFWHADIAKRSLASALPSMIEMGIMSWGTGGMASLGYLSKGKAALTAAKAAGTIGKFNTAGGVVAGGIMEGSETWNTAMEYGKEQGMTNEEAADVAGLATAIAAPIKGSMEFLGFGRMARSMGLKELGNRELSRILAGKVTQNMLMRGGTAGLKNMAQEGGTEWLQYMTDAMVQEGYKNGYDSATWLNQAWDVVKDEGWSAEARASIHGGAMLGQTTGFVGGATNAFGKHSPKNVAKRIKEVDVWADKVKDKFKDDPDGKEIINASELIRQERYTQIHAIAMEGMDEEQRNKYMDEMNKTYTPKGYGLDDAPVAEDAPISDVKYETNEEKDHKSFLDSIVSPKTETAIPNLDNASPEQKESKEYKFWKSIKDSEGYKPKERLLKYIKESDNPIEFIDNHKDRDAIYTRALRAIYDRNALGSSFDYNKIDEVKTRQIVKIWAEKGDFNLQDFSDMESGATDQGTSDSFIESLTDEDVAIIYENQDMSDDDILDSIANAVGEPDMAFMDEEAMNDWVSDTLQDSIDEQNDAFIDNMVEGGSEPTSAQDVTPLPTTVTGMKQFVSDNNVPLPEQGSGANGKLIKKDYELAINEHQISQNEIKPPEELGADTELENEMDKELVLLDKYYPEADEYTAEQEFIEEIDSDDAFEHDDGSKWEFSSYAVTDNAREVLTEKELAEIEAIVVKMNKIEEGVRKEWEASKPGTAYNVIKIISGGQIGADQFGLEVGQELGIETGGTAPPFFETADGYFKQKLESFGLVEGEPDPKKYPKRTEKNVLDSDGTVLFGDETSPGSKLTKKLAKKHGKPYIANPTAKELSKWQSENNIKTLNVAGNRTASESIKDVMLEALRNPVQATPTPQDERGSQKKPEESVGVPMDSAQRTINKQSSKTSSPKVGAVVYERTLDGTGAVNKIGVVSRVTKTGNGFQIEGGDWRNTKQTLKGSEYFAFISDADINAKYDVEKGTPAPTVTPSGEPTIVYGKTGRERSKGDLVAGKYNKERHEITIDREALQKKYDEKAWTKPKVKGVIALPKNVFKTYESFEQFVVEHEVLHSKFPQKEGETKGNYENRINKMAMDNLGLWEKESKPTPVDKQLAVAYILGERGKGSKEEIAYYNFVIEAGKERDRLVSKYKKEHDKHMSHKDPNRADAKIVEKYYDELSPNAKIYFDILAPGIEQEVEMEGSPYYFGRHPDDGFIHGSNLYGLDLDLEQMPLDIIKANPVTADPIHKSIRDEIARLEKEKASSTKKDDDDVAIDPNDSDIDRFVDDPNLSEAEKAEIEQLNKDASAFEEGESDVLSRLESGEDAGGFDPGQAMEDEAARDEYLASVAKKKQDGSEYQIPKNEQNRRDIFEAEAEIAELQKLDGVSIKRAPTGKGYENRIGTIKIDEDKQTKGTGTKIVNAFKKLLRAKGRDKIEIDVNAGSEGFWEKMGFTFVAETREGYPIMPEDNTSTINPPTEPYGRWIMEYDLTAESSPSNRNARYMPSYMSDLVTFSKIRKRLKKHFPNISAKGLETILKADGSEVLGKALGLAVEWSKSKATMDTVPHEYAHVYLNLFSQDPVIKKMIEKYGNEELAIYMGEFYANTMTGGLKQGIEVAVKNFWLRIKKQFKDLSDAESKEYIAGSFFRGKKLGVKSIFAEGQWDFNDSDENFPEYQGVDNNKQGDNPADKFTQSFFIRELGVRIAKSDYAKMSELAHSQDVYDDFLNDFTMLINKDYPSAKIQDVAEEFLREFWHKSGTKTHSFDESSGTGQLNLEIVKSDAGVAVTQKGTTYAKYTEVTDPKTNVVTQGQKKDLVRQSAVPETYMKSFAEMDGVNVIFLSLKDIVKEKLNTKTNETWWEISPSQFTMSPTGSQNDIDMTMFEADGYIYVGSKGGDHAAILFTEIPKEYKNITYMEFVKYASKEYSDGNMDDKTLGSFLTENDIKEMDDSAENVKKMAKLITQHEWWKSVKYPKYLLGTHLGSSASKPMGVQDHYDRIKLDFQNGYTMRDFGESSVMTVNAETSFFKNKYGDDIPLTDMDGWILSSGEWFKRLSDSLGKTVNGKGTMDVIKGAIRARHGKGNDINYIGLKGLQMRPFKGMKIVDNEGNLIATYIGNGDVGRWVDSEGKTFEHLSPTDSSKMTAGEYSEFNKVKTLPEGYQKITQREPKKTTSAYPVTQAEMMLGDKLLKTDIGKEWLKNTTDYYDQIIKQYSDELTTLASNPKALYKLLKKDIDEGDILPELQKHVQLIGENGEGLLHPSIIPMWKEHIANKFIKNGLFKLRNRKENMGTAMYYKPYYAPAFGGLELEQGDFIPSSKNEIMFQQVFDAYRKANNPDFRPSISALNKWLLEKDDKGSYVNNIPVLLSRQPITKITGVVLRNIRQLKEGGHGQTMFLTNFDVIKVFDGDWDGDQGKISILDSPKLIKTFQKFEKSPEFKALMKAVNLKYWGKQLQDTSLSNKGDVEKTINNINGGMLQIGAITNARNTMASMHYKGVEIILPGGIVIKPFKPTDVVVMDYKPLNVVNEIGNVDFQEQFDEIYNDNNDSIVADEGRINKGANRIKVKDYSHFLELQASNKYTFYLQTTKQNEMAIILQMAVDDSKWGLLGSFEPSPFNSSDFMDNLMFDGYSKIATTYAKKYVALVRKEFNLSGLRQGYDNEHKKMDLEGFFNASRGLNLFNDEAHRVTIHNKIVNKIIKANIFNDSTYTQQHETLAAITAAVGMKQEESNPLGSPIQYKWKPTLQEKVLLSLNEMVDTATRDNHPNQGVIDFDVVPLYFNEYSNLMAHRRARNQLLEVSNTLFDPKNGFPKADIEKGTSFAMDFAEKYFSLFDDKELSIDFSEDIQELISEFLPKWEALSEQAQIVSTFHQFTKGKSSIKGASDKIAKNRMRVFFPLDLMQPQVTKSYYKLFHDNLMDKNLNDLQALYNTGNNRDLRILNADKTSKGVSTTEVMTNDFKKRLCK